MGQVGKDVPSRSSEFAHPDIIIGLTILAYRYTGMRYQDFVDLIDNMTAEFSHEIGPARERPSSKRHEAWVLEAGGTIRGLERIEEGSGEKLAVESSKEVVQVSVVLSLSACCAMFVSLIERVVVPAQVFAEEQC